MNPARSDSKPPVDPPAKEWPAQEFQYTAQYLEPGLANRLLHTFWSELDWLQHHIRMFGRRLAEPRLTAWLGDPGAVYRYSGVQREPDCRHPELAALRDRLEVDVGSPFNSVLCNAYRDGRDAMGWHRDDEPELGDEPVIASISLGADRRFLLKPDDGGPVCELSPAHGSLIVMRGRSQRDWKHAIARTRKPVGLRINLTFRQIF